MSHYCVRLDDQHGRFWLTNNERVWREDLAKAKKFKEYDEAKRIVDKVKAKAKDNPEWFPELKVIYFK